MSDEKFDRWIVRREILNYLGHWPEKLRTSAHLSPENFPVFILAVGNCLAFIAPKLDGVQLNGESPNRSAQSVENLAQRLQEIGRESYDKRHELEKESTILFQRTIDDLFSKVESFEHRLLRQESKKRGGK